MTFERREQWQPPRVLGQSKAQLLELFAGLPAPRQEDLVGEYAGYDHLGHSAESFRAALARVEGGGGRWWLGKAFDPDLGEGYNRMLTPEGEVERRDRFSVRDGVSVWDGRPALVLRYAAFDNEPGSLDLVDDVREIRTGLYLAVATAATPDGGRSEPEFFVLSGPANPWVGVDDPELEAKR